MATFPSCGKCSVLNPLVTSFLDSFPSLPHCSPRLAPSPLLPTFVVCTVIPSSTIGVSASSTSAPSPSLPQILWKTSTTAESQHASRHCGQEAVTFSTAHSRRSTHRVSIGNSFCWICHSLLWRWLLWIGMLIVCVHYFYCKIFTIGIFSLKYFIFWKILELSSLIFL